MEPKPLPSHPWPTHGLRWPRARARGNAGRPCAFPLARHGRLILIEGRRQVGKSRFVEEFLERKRLPHVFFAATRGRAPRQELRAFAEALSRSTLPAADLVREGARFDRWEAAPDLAVSRGSDKAGVVVLDELPYLIESDPVGNGHTDRLRSFPAHAGLAGDHASPLSPAEVREIVGPEPEADFDAHLVVGEFPALVVSWGRAPDPAAFLRRELPDPTSPLVVVGERSVAAEFPPDAQVRLVMSAIGAGERTFSAIAAASGLPKVGLQRALDLLVRKRVVERLVPLSARPSRLTRYVVGDPDLRFWLRYVAPGLEEILRGRGELVVERVLGSWVEYCGRAIEPVVRASIERMLPAEAVGGARYVVSYWTRSGDVEVALVGVDRRSAPRLVGFVGGIEWRQRAAFAQEDLDGLIEQRSRVPGGARSTTLVAVSRSGFRARGEYVALGPEELLSAWRADPGGRGVE